MALVKYITKAATTFTGEKLRSNPAWKADLTSLLLPAGGAFVAVGLLGTPLGRQLTKRLPIKPAYGPAAGALLTAGVVYAAVYLSETAKKWKAPLVIGAGLAVGLQLLRILAPQYAHVAGLPRAAAPAPVPAPEPATDVDGEPPAQLPEPEYDVAAV